MNEVSKGSRPLRVLLAIGVFIALAGGAWWFFDNRDTWHRGEALGFALQSVIAGSEQDQSLVARIILENYHETRSNASRWSGIYWGFTFFAAIFSALAALVLKVETIIHNEGAKKDIAALLSVGGGIDGDHFHQRGFSTQVASQSCGGRGARTHGIQFSGEQRRGTAELPGVGRRHPAAAIARDRGRCREGGAETAGSEGQPLKPFATM